MEEGFVRVVCDNLTREDDPIVWDKLDGKIWV